MEIRSSNPVLKQSFWNNVNGHDRMTIDGSLQKIGLLLGLTVLTAFVTAVLALTSDNPLMLPAMVGLGFMGGFVLALIIMFVRPQNPAPLMTMYALFEGMAIGGVSIIFEAAYDGIVLQAAFGTVGITATMYLMYASKVIRPTPMFNKVIGGLVISIMFLYLTSYLLRFLTGMDVPFLHTSGPIGIGLTAFILVIASLTLISDFGFIESGSRYGAPKNMEWYAAFGILVSLIWIYVETLRLLSKLQALRD